MDITYKTPEGRFNLRTCAVIIEGGRILAMHDERSPYFYLPGGRIALGETAESALLREIKEELLIDAKIIRPLWLNQSFFTEEVTGEHFHELCFYFLVDVSGTSLPSRGEKFTLRERHHIHDFEWLDISRVKDEYFYPLFIKEKLASLPEAFTLHTEVE